MATPAPGTIPALPPYQPGALAITGQELLEIASSTNATTATSGYMLLVDVVGKAPSAMPTQTPSLSDLIACFSVSGGRGYNVALGNLVGQVTGNLPIGGGTGQILAKASGANFAAAWVNLSAQVTASTGISVGGSTTVAIALASAAGLSVLGVTGAAQADPAPIVGTAGQVLAVNAGGTGLAFQAATAVLPGPFQVASFTANRVLIGNGSSAIQVSNVATAAWPLVGNGTASAPGFAVLSVPGGGTNTTTLTPFGVVYGNGSATVGISAAGGTGLPLVGAGAAAGPSFAVLTPPGGGTGTSTLTAHGVLIGAGSATIGITGAGVAASVLAGNGTTSDPSFQSIASLAVTNITAGFGLSMLGVGTSGAGAITTTGQVSRVEIVAPKTAAYTFVASDLGSLVTFSSASLATWTLPTPNATSFASGWFVDVENINAGTLVLVAQTSLVNARATMAVFRNQGLRIVSDGANYQIQAGGPLSVSLNNTAQLFTGGLRLSPFSVGTTTGGTAITLDSGNGPIQTMVNNGTGTLTAPANDGEIDLLVTNSTAAGALTFSGYSVGANTGDAYTTTSTQKFILMSRTISAQSTYKWAALQ